MIVMIYCKKCGTALPDDAVYCVKCGTKVDRPVSSQSGDADKTRPLPTAPTGTAQDPGKKPDLAAEASKLSKPKQAVPPAHQPGDIDDNKSSNALIAVVGGAALFIGALFIGYHVVGPGASSSTATPKVTSSAKAPAQTAEQKKASKSARQGDRKQTVYKFDTSKRKRPENVGKRNLIDTIQNALVEIGAEGMEVTNPERELNFMVNGTKYKVVLSCPRK